MKHPEHVYHGKPSLPLFEQVSNERSVSYGAQHCDAQEVLRERFQVGSHDGNENVLGIADGSREGRVLRVSRKTDDRITRQVSCGDDSRYDAGCRYPTERPAGIPQAPTRRGSRATSYAAAKSVKGISELQHHILALFRKCGQMTDEKLFEMHRIHALVMASPSGIRSRRAELVRMGLVEDSGQTAQISTGRNAIVWRLK